MFAHLLRAWFRHVTTTRPIKRLPKRRRTIGPEPLEGRMLLAGPEIAVFDGAVELVDGATAAIIFANVVQGQPGPTRAFTIRNDGDAPLTIESLSLPAGFTLLEQPVRNLAPGAATLFRVGLDSTTVGVKTGEISFRNTDDDENPFNFTITGTVIVGGPEITVLDTGMNIADGTTTPIDFGSTRQRLTGPTHTFTVRNDGTASLSLGTISLPTGYLLTESLPPSLEPGRSAAFSVMLATAATGERAGQISFSNGDADESPFNFPIMGTVTNPGAPGPEISVFDGFANVLDGSTVAINFGTVLQSQTGPTRTFIVRNDGTATLRFTTLNVPAGFAVTEGLVTSLVSGGEDRFTVQLDTTTAGVLTGDIQITTNDSNEGVFNFAIAGTVLASDPEIRVFREDLLELVDGVTPASVFPTAVETLTASVGTFAVVNVGAGTLTLGPVTLPAGFSLAEGLAANLGPGEFDTFSVQLDNTTPGMKSGDIEITSNDADESPFNIAIQGTVLASVPEITVLLGPTNIADGTAEPLELGRPAQGQPAPTVSFTIRNDGATPLTLGTVTLPRGFTLFGPVRSILAPGQSDGLAVRIDTRFAATYSGEISIVTNDADENPFNFAVTATVTPAPLPEITVFDGAAELVSGSPVVIDFGNVLRRQTGPTRTFTIRNDGTATLTIRKIDLPRGFTLIGGQRRKLAAGASDTITIRLDSKIAGTKSGRVAINNDDRDEPGFTLFITGTVLG